MKTTTITSATSRCGVVSSQRGRRKGWVSLFVEEDGDEGGRENELSAPPETNPLPPPLNFNNKTGSVTNHLPPPLLYAFSSA